MSNRGFSLFKKRGRQGNKKNDMNSEPVKEIETEQGLTLTDDIDQTFTEFCKKYIILMKLLSGDKELSEWCRGTSAYNPTAPANRLHRKLRSAVYDGFMQEAYAMPFFTKFLGATDYATPFERFLSGTKSELIQGLFLEIRGDYGSNGSLLCHAIPDGKIYRLMDAYLHYGKTEAVPKVEVVPIQTKKERIAVGEKIVLGRYPQNPSGEATPILWKVLDITDGKALLISKECLITSPYCRQPTMSDLTQLEWEHSLAREICNTHFLPSAFTEQEHTALLKKLVVDGVGTACLDKVFLLSEEEIVRYFPAEEERIAKPTLAAAKCGAFQLKGNSCWWTLPDISLKECQGAFYPKAVTDEGTFYYHGRCVAHVDYTIRPCILLDINKYFNLQDRRGEISHPNQSVQYTLEYVKAFADRERKTGIGERRTFRDISSKKWRLIIQLDEEQYWFLSVFFHEDGAFDKFSLDYEAASDSRFEFCNEEAIRMQVYVAGDEKRLLDEIFIRYAKEHGGVALERLIRPYITAQFHYD